MKISISKNCSAEINEGFNIHLESMTSAEFDDVRILLKDLVDNDKRFSGVTYSELDLKFVVSLLNNVLNKP